MLTPTDLDHEPLAHRLPGEDVAQAIGYARAARSAHTRKYYASDWEQFADYCATHWVVSLPATPQTVAAYLASLSGRFAVATIRRRVAAIAAQHKDAGFTAPTAHHVVESVVAGLARTYGTAPKRKAALTINQLKKMVDVIDDGSVRGMRDKALLLMAFAGALRRSEVVALNIEDLIFSAHGLKVMIRSSKTDQEKRGSEIAIPYSQNVQICAVRAMEVWLGVAEIEQGAVFRSFALPRGRTVSTMLQSQRLSGVDLARLIKRSAAAIGLDPREFGGHSTRAGFITSAAVAGASEASIQRVSRHSSIAVLRTYIRHATIFDDSPFAKLE
jgi:integrase